MRSATASLPLPTPAVPERPSPFAPIAFLGWLAASVVWWVLAFAPLPLPPEWLERARAVCFGSPPGGLPDTWGWMVLVLGPLSLLAFLLAVWSRDLGRWGGRLARHPAGAVALAVLAISPLLLATWLADRVAAVSRAAAAGTALAAGEGEALPEGYPRIAEPAPAISLVDQHGQRVDVTTLGGRPTLVTFAYAHCLTVCPVLVSSLRRAAGELGPRAGAVVITLDPWRDTPSSLPTLAASWGLDRLPDARLLSGPIDDVLAVHSGWGITAGRDEATGEISHPGLVFVLDDAGRIAFRFLNPPASWLVDAVDRLEREAA